MTSPIDNYNTMKKSYLKVIGEGTSPIEKRVSVRPTSIVRVGGGSDCRLHSIATVAKADGLGEVLLTSSTIAAGGNWPWHHNIRETFITLCA